MVFAINVLPEGLSYSLVWMALRYPAPPSTLLLLCTRSRRELGIQERGICPFLYEYLTILFYWVPSPAFFWMFKWVYSSFMVSKRWFEPTYRLAYSRDGRSMKNEKFSVRSITEVTQVQWHCNFKYLQSYD